MIFVEMNGGVMAANENSQRVTVLASAVDRVAAPVTYRETSSIEIEKLDVLEQLRSNLDLLEDLHGRLKFVLGEIKTHLPRR